MKNRWTRLQVLLAAALVLLLCLGLAAGCASADGVYSICSGQASVNGTTETLFYVRTTQQNASIVLSQDYEGIMKFNQVNQWGYTIQTKSRKIYAYYVLNSRSSYQDWTYTGYPDSTNYTLRGLEWSGKSYTLWFGQPGTYTVRVQSPANRANKASGLDWLETNYKSSMGTWKEDTWTYIPTWSVTQMNGCTVSMAPQPTAAPATPTPTVVPVQQTAFVTVRYADDQGGILYSELREVRNAEYITAPSTYAGYTLISTSSRKITVINGKAYPDTVIFQYSRNSGGTSKRTADAWVTYVDQDTGTILYYYKVTLTEGNNAVYAPQTYSGYQRTTYSPMTVTLYANGSFSPSQIVFYYRTSGGYTTPVPTPVPTAMPTTAPYTPVTPIPTVPPYTPMTPVPTSVPAPTAAPTNTPPPAPTAAPYTPVTPTYPPSGVTNIVYPTGWDTQFKPGTATASGGSNAQRYLKLPNLYDDDPSTSFFWVVWNSERKDSIPELSVYFGGDTVSAVGIRNGNCKSEYTFNKYAHARFFRVVVTHDQGVDMVTIELSKYYSANYQVCSLGRAFTGVTRIDFYLGDENSAGYFGGTEEENIVHISDMQFYQ